MEIFQKSTTTVMNNKKKYSYIYLLHASCEKKSVLVTGNQREMLMVSCPLPHRKTMKQKEREGFLRAIQEMGQTSRVPLD